ncbi:hypothetical protein [Arachidicoccus soli]|uniref:Uncharacterized protein n=1 Tax=Arachidicoccus soli TaxID=2341117 RepID=A0A386HU99_9BACT|nr:hypothetical protein [Arachidicoccus soli]AYD48884.1 hypothetical protein D6B99_15475 [Arachidicoccus soli]
MSKGKGATKYKKTKKSRNNYNIKIVGVNNKEFDLAGLYYFLCAEMSIKKGLSKFLGILFCGGYESSLGSMRLNSVNKIKHYLCFINQFFSFCIYFYWQICWQILKKLKAAVIATFVTC